MSDTDPKTVIEAAENGVETSTAEEVSEELVFTTAEQENDVPPTSAPSKEEPSEDDLERGGGGERGSTPYRYPLPVGDVTCVCRPSLWSFRLFWGWAVSNKDQVLAGITVALAQVPEAVSFSFVAGVSPIVGLHSAWIMGICTSLGGGRPGMVAGATGAVAVVLPKLVQEHGVGHMFYAVMLAGLIQMAFGFLKLGTIVRLIPHPVMVGFCNGLGIVIGVAQFNIFKVNDGSGGHGNDYSDIDMVAMEDNGGSGRRLTEIGGAFAPFTNGLPWVDSTMAGWMAFHIVITIATYILFPKLTKAIPGSLAAIMVSTAFEWALVRNVGYETNTVADLASVAGSFPVPIWIDTKYDYAALTPPLTWKVFSEIYTTSITVAAIGLLESLLTLQIIDELTKTKGNSNREAFGQGLGQFLCGIFGGMGGCTTIGQSLMNIHSGGYTRLSSSVAAIFMLIIILAAYPLINLIPVASLAGVMFLVTYFTIEWDSGIVVLGTLLPLKLRQRWGIHTKVKRSDVLVMLVVVGVTLAFDLAIAVAVGIVISCLVFSWDAGTRLHLERAVSNDGTSVFYTVTGPIFFGSVTPLLALFPDDLEKEPKDVTILLEGAEIYDWSGMVAVKKLHERFDAAGATSVQFKSLTVATHRLMVKGEHLWEGVNIMKEHNEEIIEVEEDKHITAHMHVEQRENA